MPAGRGSATAAGAPGPAALHRSDGQLGRGRRPTGRRRRPGCSAGADEIYRAVLALRRPRFPRHRPQGHLRRQLLADAANDRLAACRAGHAVPGLRPAGARGRATRPNATPRPTALAGKPQTCQQDSRRLAAGQVSPEAGADLLASLRSAGPAEACEQVVELLNKGVDPASLWDGLFLTAGELLMRQPGIVGIHCVTATQCPALRLPGQRQRRDAPAAAAASGRLFAHVPPVHGRAAANCARSYASTPWKSGAEKRGASRPRGDLCRRQQGPGDGPARPWRCWSEPDADPRALMTAARRLVFTKGNDSHDYKFSSAALEDYYHATPSWRPVTWR